MKWMMLILFIFMILGLSVIKTDLEKVWLEVNNLKIIKGVDHPYRCQIFIDDKPSAIMCESRVVNGKVKCKDEINAATVTINQGWDIRCFTEKIELP